MTAARPFLIEVWRDIPTLPSGYQASNWGRVRSWRRGGRVRTLRETPRLRKAVPNLRGGYLTMGFSVDGKHVMRYVHQLVLEAFGFSRTDDKAEVRHLNRDLTDNRLDNICWGTHIENTDDQRRHGTLTVGEKNGGAKLTNAVARGIRRSSEKGCVLANRHQVSQATISRIRHGERYAE